MLVHASGSQRVCWRTYDRCAELGVWSVECLARLRQESQLLAPGRVTASRLNGHVDALAAPHRDRQLAALALDRRSGACGFRAAG